MSKRGKRRRWTCRRIILTALLGIVGIFVLMLIFVMGNTRQSSSNRQITQQAQTVVAADHVQSSATITDTPTHTPTQMEPLAATQAALETSQAELAQRQAEINAAQTQRAMPTATATLSPVPSPTLTETPIPSPIPPTDAPAQTFYTTSSANARACPQLDCDIVTILQAGTAIEAVGTATGDTYQGSTLWRIVKVGGQRAYVHSKLVSQKPPRPTSPPVQAQPVQPQYQAPTVSPGNGATARCNDGTYSYAAHHQGACSRHGGVAVFYK